MRGFPAGAGAFGARVHQVRRETHDTLVDQDDPERRQGVVEADLEAGVRDAQLAQSVDRLGAALTPAEPAELRVAFGLRIDEQEPHRAAAVVEALEQPDELGPDVGVGDPFGREYASEAEPGDRLGDALQRLEL